MKIKSLLFITCWCVSVLIAKADYLFTWEGSSNLFQGTFQVTDAEMLNPNLHYTSLSLTNSISITSPDGLTYRWGPGLGDQFAVNGGSLVGSFGIGLFYPQPNPQGHQLYLEAVPDSIQELELIPGGSANVLYSEAGQWEVGEVPEPSLTMFLALGFVAWLIKQRKSS